MNTLEDMQTFIRVVEAGSITAAANQMHMAKSVISRRLQLLETRLGVILLKRTTRNQKLTDAGQLYYQHSLRIVADIHNTESLLKDEQLQLSGIIRMAAPLSYGIRHLSELLLPFQKKHPEIKFDLDLNDRMVNLVEEGFDIALRIGHLKDSGLKVRFLTNFKIHICASPEYLKLNGHINQIDDLINCRMIRYAIAPESWKLQDGAKEITINMNQTLVSNSGEINLQWAIEGQGLVMLPDFICQQAIDAGQLVSLLPNIIDKPKVPCHAVFSESKYMPLKVRKLLNHLVDHFSLN